MQQKSRKMLFFCLSFMACVEQHSKIQTDETEPAVDPLFKVNDVSAPDMVKIHRTDDLEGILQTEEFILDPILGMQMTANLQDQVGLNCRFGQEKTVGQGKSVIKLQGRFDRECEDQALSTKRSRVVGEFLYFFNCPGTDLSPFVGLTMQQWQNKIKLLGGQICQKEKSHLFFQLQESLWQIKIDADVKWEISAQRFYSISRDSGLDPCTMVRSSTHWQDAGNCQFLQKIDVHNFSKFRNIDGQWLQVEVSPEERGRRDDYRKVIRQAGFLGHHSHPTTGSARFFINDCSGEIDFPNQHMSGSCETTGDFAMPLRTTDSERKKIFWEIFKKW